MFSGLRAELGHQLLDGEQDAVVAATGAPAHLLVARPVLLAGDVDVGRIGHRGPPASSSSMRGLDLAGRERETLDLAQRPGVDEVLGADDAGELAGVELGHEHLREASHDVAEVARQRVEVGDVDPRHLAAVAATALHGGVDGGPRRAPPDDEQLGVVVADDRQRRDVLGDGRHLGGAEVDHPLVVLRRVVDVAGAVLLLDAADAVHQARRAGDRPRAGQRVGIAEVGPELGLAVGVGVVLLGGEGHRDVGQRVEVGQPPRLGAVGEVAVGQQDHRRAVLEGDADRLDRGDEAVRRAVRRDDRQRCLAVTAEQGDVEVGGLGLGRQAGRRAAALDVDDEQRQLERDGERDRLALEGQAGPAGGGDAEVAGEGGAERHADGGDLVLGLHGADAEVLVLRQLVEDVRGRRDRVRAERDRELGELTGGDDAPRQRGVAGDARVLAGGQRRRSDLEAVADGLGGLAEVEAGEERGAVGRRHQLVLGEALLDPFERRVGGPAVHPRHQPEGEEVLRALGVAGLDAERRRGLLGDRRSSAPGSRGRCRGCRRRAG